MAAAFIDPTCYRLDRLDAQADAIVDSVDHIAAVLGEPNDDHCGDAQLAHCRRVAILEARRRGLSVDEAEDLAQEVGIKLLAVLRAAKIVRHIPAWTRKTTGRHVIDMHRVLSHPDRGYGLVQSLSDYDDTRD